MNPPTSTPNSDPVLTPLVRRENRGSWVQFFTARGFEWTVAELPIPGLPADLDGFRLLHLSDLHARSRWDGAYDRLIRHTVDQPPDLILFTGDFVDHKYDPRPALPIVCRLVNQLKSRLGFI